MSAKDVDDAISQLAVALYGHSKDPSLSSHVRELLDAGATEITRLRAALIGTAKALETYYPTTAKLIRDEVNKATYWNKSMEITRHVQ